MPSWTPSPLQKKQPVSDWQMLWNKHEETDDHTAVRKIPDGQTLNPMGLIFEQKKAREVLGGSSQDL